MKHALTEDELTRFPFLFPEKILNRDSSLLDAVLKRERSVSEGGATSKHRTFLQFLSRSISTSLDPTSPEDPVTRIVEFGVVLNPAGSSVILLKLLFFRYYLLWISYAQTEELNVVNRYCMI